MSESEYLVTGFVICEIVVKENNQRWHEVQADRWFLLLWLGRLGVWDDR